MTSKVNDRKHSILKYNNIVQRNVQLHHNLYFIIYLLMGFIYVITRLVVARMKETIVY